MTCCYIAAHPGLCKQYAETDFYRFELVKGSSESLIFLYTGVKRRVFSRTLKLISVPEQKLTLFVNIGNTDAVK